MFTLLQVDTNKVSLVENYNDGETAVNELLELWHEDDDTRLFVVYEGNEVYATIMRGHNPDEATVCRNGGAAQRFLINYETTANGKYLSTTINSCE